MPKPIKAIRFGLLSPEQIRKLSVVEIQTSDTYDEDGAPIPLGLMDGRLGTLEPRQRCKTCGNPSISCPGHFGHIELAMPVTHVEFGKNIHRLLLSTCRNCGRVLLPEEKIEAFKQKFEDEAKLYGRPTKETQEALFHEARRYKRFRKCPHCGTPQLDIKFVKPTSFHEVEKGVDEQPDKSPVEEVPRKLTPSMIRERFERINSDDLQLLGFDPEVARPEWMILQALPVPPVDVRPSIILESGIRAEDDLTHKLVDIIRINQRLKENMEAGAPVLIIEDLSELLQYHVTTYFNNEVSGIPPARHRSGRTLKSLAQRLKGKEGRFRGNLSGKRVDYSARTVISGDPNIDFNEVGVPLHVATHLTVPEIVTTMNIDEMRKYVRNGPYVHPGALYIIRPDGKRIRLEYVADKESLAQTLEPGLVIERHLMDDDITIFNRQPSLHRMSIMAHRVKVLPYKTFRLHPAVCPPYNADFDGDEMNLHVPQSKEAQTEARLLMQVQDQILSPRYGAPIIGAHKDYITGAYMLTRSETMLTASEVGQLLAASGYSGQIPEPSVQEPVPLWSGKDIFSIFLPKELNFVAKAKVCQRCPTCKREECPHDAYVKIREGRLVSGVIDKNSIGAEMAETIFHRIVKDFGPDVGHDFLNSTCKLIMRFLGQKGFTYALDELEIGDRVKRQIDRSLSTSEKEIEGLISKFEKGDLERLPGQTLKETFELQVMNELAKARDRAGEIVDEQLTLENAGIVMTRTGARGSSLNIGQMMGCIGQQAIRGKRIMRGYSDRTLPHFKPNDPRPEARGFVYSCYREGLNPIEFFFHSMGGREGLVDTAVRTQQSGYMQRRLINALEHLRVEYDETVRDSLGNIVQFRYGEDGVDPSKSDHGKAINLQQLFEKARISTKQTKPASKEYIRDRLQSSAPYITQALTKELQFLLAKEGVSENTVDQILDEVVKSYDLSQVEPGEAVGTVAAQSIGEPGTQMTLRTFHFAGVRELNVTLGLPRLIEIVDARRLPSTPVMTMYLEKEYARSIEKVREIAKKITHTTVEDVTESIDLDIGQDAVRIRLDQRKMADLGVSQDDVEKALPEGQVMDGEYSFLVPLGKTKSDDPERLIDRIASLGIKGIPEIKRVLTIQEGGEWVIKTEGSDLEKTLYILGVDPTQVVTNDIYEIARIFGVEAARNALIAEASSVLEEQGLDVDVRHVMLVADIMTSSGEIQQIGRHGVSGEKSSVLARAAFELTVPHLVDASIKGEVDPLKGVVENIIVGQSIPLGTGSVDLYMAMRSDKANGQSG